MITSAIEPELGHRPAGLREQRDRVVRRGAAPQQGEPLDVGVDEEFPDTDALERVAEPRTFGHPEELGGSWSPQVGVDQYHPETGLGQGPRDVGGGGALTLAGQGRGDHDHVEQVLRSKEAHVRGERAVRLGRGAAGFGGHHQIGSFSIAPAFDRGDHAEHRRVDLLRELVTVLDAVLEQSTADREDRADQGTEQRSPDDHGGQADAGRRLGEDCPAVEASAFEPPLDVLQLGALRLEVLELLRPHGPLEAGLGCSQIEPRLVDPVVDHSDLLVERGLSAGDAVLQIGLREGVGEPLRGIVVLVLVPDVHHRAVPDQVDPNPSQEFPGRSLSGEVLPHDLRDVDRGHDLGFGRHIDLDR